MTANAKIKTRLLLFIVCVLLLTWVIPVDALANTHHGPPRVTIDDINAHNGYIRVKMRDDIVNCIRVKIIYPCGMSKNYAINEKGIWFRFSLTQSGDVTVIVAERIVGNRFAILKQTPIHIVHKNPLSPFLASTQLINFTYETSFVQLAHTIANQSTFVMQNIVDLYMWVVQHFEYNFDFAAYQMNTSTPRLLHDNIPCLEDLYVSLYGVCIDFTVVLAAMLRSQGIPAKVAIGRMDNLLHAWLYVNIAGIEWDNHQSVTFFNQTIHKNEILNNVCRDGWLLMCPTLTMMRNQARSKDVSADNQNIRRTTITMSGLSQPDWVLSIYSFH